MIAQEVIDYLELLHSQQWQFIFITGRPYTWGSSALLALPFPYFLAIYNGAYLLSLPQGQIAERYLLERDYLNRLNAIAEKYHTGLVVLGGLEEGESIYFTVSKFDDATLAFFEKRWNVSNEKWTPGAPIDEIPLAKFTSAKFFVDADVAEQIAQEVEEELELHVPLIKDPVDPSYTILQCTHSRANKGDALENFSSICGWSGIRIAAGNDSNDIPMFQKAQITIAMQDSPLALRQLATFIAPPVEDLGLVEGLKAAIAKLETRR